LLQINYFFLFIKAVISTAAKATTRTNNINGNRVGIEKPIITTNRVIITIINVPRNSFFPNGLPNSSFILTRDYLGRSNLHNASEIQPSPIPLKSIQRVRVKIISGLYEKFRVVDSARNITRNVPINENTIPPIIKARIYSLSIVSYILSPLMIAYSDMNINLLGG
jgi:hypothetical protein